ncbi:MAG TPA: hypothetical protein VGI70_09325, partial [Polyangiales bacterium]
MYSGITRGLFSVVALEARDGVTRFSVELSPELAHDAQIGASIAIDGVCLTLVERAGTRLSFEVIEETRSLTTLGELTVGRKVSVERSAKLGDELGGHDVYGHAIGTGTIVKTR